MANSKTTYRNFADFYPFYLGQHQNRNCRRLHILGSSLVLGTLLLALVLQNWSFLIPAPLFGYGFAWVGHFVFEKNRPATFQYPLYSFIGDWVMYKDVLTGKIPF